MSIEITGDTGAVDTIRAVCDLSPCGMGPVERVENPWIDRSTPTPAPTVDVMDAYAYQVDADTWKVSFPFKGPDRATILATASNGDVLAERDVTFEWKRVGGSERCGGPMEAEPITLGIES